MSLLRTLTATMFASLLFSAPTLADGHKEHAMDEAATVITVHKSPSCGCCKHWIAHLEAEGFEVHAHDSDDMSAVKKELGVPNNMRSCHTAEVGGYIVEGHVPANDIRRMLTERPDATGIAVPGMPLGSPGMEMGNRFNAYKVMLFDDNINSVYASYDEAPDADVESE